MKKEMFYWVRGKVKMGELRELWHCDNCGFGFDACHTNEDGGYTCPVCELAEMKALALEAVNLLDSPFQKNIKHNLLERPDVKALREGE